MIPLVAASERGCVAKPGAWETWWGLRVGCCGVWCVLVPPRPARDGCVSAEVGWEALPERVRVPYVKACGCCVVTMAPSSGGLVESVVNLPGPPGKPEYSV